MKSREILVHVRRGRQRARCRSRRESHLEFGPSPLAVRQLRAQRDDILQRLPAGDQGRLGLATPALGLRDARARRFQLLLERGVLRIEVADAHAQRQQLGVGELRGAAQFGQAPLEHLARRLRFAEVTSQRLDIVLGRRRRGRRLRPCFGRRDPCIGEQGCQVGESLLE
ncbi:MAG TPA: hypothetical protein VFF36_09425, partial [Planctomycetota bacterium]|nr:hypothetical protein [Planctomycetota bacterium]